MIRENDKTFTLSSDTETEKDDGVFRPGRDGMSTATARITIDRKLRKR